MAARLKIGTRGSPLALAQASELAARLTAEDPSLADAGAIETVVIRTTGDMVRDRPLSEIGGKGLFTRELDEALLDRRIDVAVHSMKDVPTWLPDGLHIPCLLPREDPRDAIFGNGLRHIADLPQGAVVGTAALRRQAQLLARRPDLKVVPLRGNVGTRLRKLAEGEVDATLLAVAGLRRLGEAGRITAILEPDEMLPAVAQGAIGVACRIGDEAVESVLAALHCAATGVRVTAERALLAALDGSCRTPIAALASLDGGDTVTLEALVALPDGSGVHQIRRSGGAGEAAALGDKTGRALKSRAGPEFLSWQNRNAPP
ncbi:MAG: hydroxymethylbilane synthase [Inquilinus sp.]|nr:hydroxymethylbilane synthase [Inquilinus sp.]